jgi:hypothetical protein
MPDKALRGRGLLGKRLGSGMGRLGRKKPIMTYEEEINAHPQEAMGVYASGGHEGKPHSTKEGRLAAGHRNLTRFFYGRKKKKPKGTTA